jgi:hypothetical protein
MFGPPGITRNQSPECRGGESWPGQEKEQFEAATSKDSFQKPGHLELNINTINPLFVTVMTDPIPFRNHRIFRTIQIQHDQHRQLFVHETRSRRGRIVSIHQICVRPAPGGKDKLDTEFRTKLGDSVVE